METKFIFAYEGDTGCLDEITTDRIRNPYANIVMSVQIAGITYPLAKLRCGLSPENWTLDESGDLPVNLQRQLLERGVGELVETFKLAEQLNGQKAL